MICLVSQRKVSKFWVPSNDMLFIEQFDDNVGPRLHPQFDDMLFIDNRGNVHQWW